MAIQSMTGFARAEDSVAGCRFTWELRSVNGKGLDLRFRLPQGYEHLEPALRATASSVLRRGNVQLSLNVSDLAQTTEAVVNEAALEAVIALIDRLGDRIDARRPSLDGILAMKGIVDFREPQLSDADRLARDGHVIEGFNIAVAALVAMREREGEDLARVLSGQIDTIAALTKAAEDNPARSPEAIRARLAEQVAILMDAASTLDRDRLHMEAALLATRADLREEIDRLKAHVDAARELLASNGSVGRRLDFLAQEFNRETNTICSKSNAASITAIGLDLKVVIDQFREQVQNLE